MASASRWAERALTVLVAVALSAATVAALAALWEGVGLVEFAGVSVVLPLYAAVAGVQLARLARLDDDARQAGIVGTLLGLAVVDSGLGRSNTCVVNPPGPCRPFLDWDAGTLAVGLGLLTVGLAADFPVRRLAAAAERRRWARRP